MTSTRTAGGTRPIDRHDIAAEVKRRGSTLTKIAIEAGAHPTTCRAAVRRKIPKGEAIIANFLGIPAHELWPDRYEVTSEGKVIPRGRRRSSPIRAGV